jgi:CopG family transcriptional regulator, nickel-responsive regulator
MDKIERIGVSLESELLEAFDGLIAQKGYKNRSEAIRDLIRTELSKQRVEDPDASALGVVLLVYDHHVTKLTEKLLHLQHSHLLHTISSLHVHLDHHHCLEIIVLKGEVSKINLVGEQMVSLKGVKLGRVNLVSTDATEE